LATIYLCRDRKTLHDGARKFNPATLSWSELEIPAPDSTAVSPGDAIHWLYTEGKARLVPVGVIGPRDATARQLAVAEQLGQRLGALSIPLLNGGKNGVMEAVSKGCAEAGGLVLGFVPDDDWTAANDYVTVPIATGLGKARNVLIAQASLALIAVGGGYGTLSEIAFGLHFDKPVFTLEGAPAVEGACPKASVEDVIDDLILVILKLHNDP
jgi:uncharacterized protein (TIGR00725 family)